MKKSKLIKIIVFSFVFIASIASMITLFVYHSTMSNVTVTFDKTSITLNGSSYYTIGNMSYGFTLKNDTVQKIEDCKVEWDIYLKCNDKLLRHAYYNVKEVEANDTTEFLNCSFSIDSAYLLGSGIDKNNLTVDDFEIKNISISYIKEEVNVFTIIGCALIPVVIVSGGLLLSTLLDKENKKTECNEKVSLM